MSRQAESITLSVTTNEKAILEEIAKNFNYVRGDAGNISALLRAIASGELELVVAQEVSVLRRLVAIENKIDRLLQQHDAE